MASFLSFLEAYLQWVLWLPSDKEIWTAANQVVKQHGDGADEFVQERMRTLGAKGDTEGRDVWCRIGVAARRLRLKDKGDETIR